MALRMAPPPAHVAYFTEKCMEDHKLKWIPKEHWFTNSPDIARMDFAVNKILRKILKKRQAYSVHELVCVAKSEWV